MSTITAPQRAAILVRISDARDGDTDGTDRQRADCRDLAGRLGWGTGPDDTHLITENGTSAYKRRKVCRSCLKRHGNAPARRCRAGASGTRRCAPGGRDSAGWSP